MKILILLSLIGLTNSAYALIPTSKTILIRAAKAHGKGAYVIDQDITLKVEGEPVVVRETWTVLNAETMRLSVNRRGSATDSQIKMDFVYRGGRRNFVDSTGAIKATGLSSEFMEPYFFYRTSNSLQTSLQKARILPGDFGMKSRQIISANAKDKSETAPLMSVTEPYVRLSRTGGVVNYALGKASDNSANEPGIWIEQDAFTIRKIKFPTASEVQADQYLTYANQLRFPRERTVKWGNYSATVRVVSIRAATDAEATKQLNLSSASGEDSASKVPEIPGLKEFYSRFR